MNKLAIEVNDLLKCFDSTEGIIERVRCALGLVKPNPKAAVNKVSFKVYQGETIGLLGRNASGKSTVIRILSTLVHRDSGIAKVFGFDVESQSAQVKGLIGRVSVDASFWKMLSPLENLQHYALLYGLDTKDALHRSREMLNKFGVIERDLKKPVRQLSRGTQQKVAIVRALLHSPRMLLLDEPTTGLDPASKLSVHAFLKEQRERNGTTILLTTHDMKEAEALCERLVFMTQGKIVADGTLEELKKKNNDLEELFVLLTGENLEDWKDKNSLVEPKLAAGGG